eukprot:GHVN01020425.1.p1 GENE.GHVN01020425.1~~GHVN01020425.1.p1  ORF type:complete len:122 (+),score=18.02 GHVN01020425.1:557-922(+)
MGLQPHQYHHRKGRTHNSFDSPSWRCEGSIYECLCPLSLLSVARPPRPQFPSSHSKTRFGEGSSESLKRVSPLAHVVHTRKMLSTVRQFPLRHQEAQVVDQHLINEQSSPLREIRSPNKQT